MQRLASNATAATPSPYDQRGFSLIELLVAIGIVGILIAIAAPSYRDQIRRGAVQEGTEALASGRVNAEQYFLDNRTYAFAPCPANTERFTLSCVSDATTYTLTATGSGNVAGFVYTINQAGTRTTAGTWGSGNCWIVKKGMSC
jgi:type IV pilus assembly protein PilE